MERVCEQRCTESESLLCGWLGNSTPGRRKGKSRCSGVSAWGCRNSSPVPVQSGQAGLGESGSWGEHPWSP